VDGFRGSARDGRQILVRRPQPLPWGFAYAPRGPVGSGWSSGDTEAFTELVRRKKLTLAQLTRAGVDEATARRTVDPAAGGR